MCFDTDTIIKICVFVASLLLCPLMLWIGRNPLKRYTDSHDGVFSIILKNIFQTPFVVAFVVVVSFFTIDELPFFQPYQRNIRRGYMVMFVINITWFVVELICSLLDKIYERSKNASDGIPSIDINLVKTLKKVISAILWFIGIIVALKILGVDIAALVTTLGIGGIAVALAAQETVKNIIGGITILTDRQVRIGDRVIVGEIDGVVEDIGIRTTKIRLLDNRIASMPNSLLVDKAIVNVTSEPTRKVICKLGLTYDTTPEQVEEAIAILKSLPQENKKISKNVIASFEEFGEYSLNIKFIYYIKLPVEKTVLEETSKINIAILKKFKAAGLNFAFPTQTVILDKTE